MKSFSDTSSKSVFRNCVWKMVRAFATVMGLPPDAPAQALSTAALRSFFADSTDDSSVASDAFESMPTTYATPGTAVVTKSASSGTNACVTSEPFLPWSATRTACFGEPVALGCRVHCVGSIRDGSWRHAPMYVARVTTVRSSVRCHSTKSWLPSPYSSRPRRVIRSRQSESGPESVATSSSTSTNESFRSRSTVSSATQTWYLSMMDPKSFASVVELSPVQFACAARSYASCSMMASGQRSSAKTSTSFMYLPVSVVNGSEWWKPRCASQTSATNSGSVSVVPASQCMWSSATKHMASKMSIAATASGSGTLRLSAFRRQPSIASGSTDRSQPSQSRRKSTNAGR
mmetsp:Transcript_30513/g.94403  ORF Transcript_30513/g.94403 Transcript_30513/m.94403 type:complete len:346 (-) Transcript_30513:844-1881(-)